MQQVLPNQLRPAAPSEEPDCSTRSQSSPQLRDLSVRQPLYLVTQLSIKPKNKLQLYNYLRPTASPTSAKLTHSMKTLGLLGGMSWESTATYYQQINRRVRAVQGGLHSAKCIVFSFDFAEIEALQRAGQWDQASTLLDQAAARLRLAGADAIVLCTNTMHIVSGNMAAAAGVPLIHIVDPTAEAIRKAGFKAPGLLGTRFTMEKEFYKVRLAQEHGLQAVVPNAEDREVVHSIIYNELCNGIIKTESREAYTKVIRNLAAAGADCLILGCTEIGLLVTGDSSGLPVFDTAELHAVAAADWAMKE